MSIDSTATHRSARALPPGLIWGAVGVLAFSLTLPATQVAVRQFGWLVATSGRASVAAGLAAVYLLARRARLPGRAMLLGLALVTAGVVVGFPLFTALALQRSDSAHGAIIVGLLPSATAVLGVLRTGERPSPVFWAACGAGAVSVGVFAFVQGAGLPTAADGLTVLAVLSAAVGYAEGARLAPLLGSDQVICWALLLSTPLMLPALTVGVARSAPMADRSGWLCLAYTAVVSMFLGFFAWYRGLALGGVAKVSQLQLVQPLLTVTESVVLLGQRPGPGVLIAAVLVLACVGIAQRCRVAPSTPGSPRTLTPARPTTTARVSGAGGAGGSP